MPIGIALPETSLVLDNDAFTLWRNQQGVVVKAVNDYVRRLKAPPSITSVTVFEALYGLESSQLKTALSHEDVNKYRARIETLVNQSVVLPFDQNAATIAAYIFARLSRSQRNTLWRDLFIAATALAYNHGIATRNKRDFEAIAMHLPSAYPLLRLDVWKV